MTLTEQIDDYIDNLPQAKRSDMRELQKLITKVLPDGKSWFLDGRNNEGKVVSNPSIGYGHYFMKYTDGSTREFYQIGLSANTSGISVYILGIDDKNYLAQTYGSSLGKATVSGYCIRFKSLADIDTGVLEAAIRYGVKITTDS